MIYSNDIKELGYLVKKRDKRAFYVLYKNYFVKFQTFAYRYVYNWSEAQDIVQEAFFTLWLEIDKYDPEQNLQSYLLTIIKNSCLKYLRHLKVVDKNQHKVAETLFFSGIEESEIDPGTQARLKSAIASLPEKGYYVILQHIVHRKKIKDIAVEMKVTESTVKTHLKRAMKILREHLICLF